MAKPAPARPQNRPEKKIGPFPGGIALAIWINTVNTESGPRKIRSITLSPRRYQDSESGQWKDSNSFRPGDLPALIFALQRAQEYIFTTPLPGENQESDGEGLAY